MLWRHAFGCLELDRPRILGIVNVTPDSFSDGGRLRSVDDARRLIDQMIADGADIVDIGGESTRPQGATPVNADEELRRVMPVLEAAIADHPGVPVSIDTVKARVAREALCAGASIVNDVSALRLDADMSAVCVEARAGVVLMHSRGDVADMATFAHADYGSDAVAEIIAELGGAVRAARSAGIEAERVVIDPGLGFSKRADDSLTVLAQLRRFEIFERPILVGASRKRFIGTIAHAPAPADRVAGTVGAHVAALDRGAMLFRVHDVKAARQSLDVAWAIAAAGRARQ